MKKAYQNDDLQDVQMTRLATWRTALMMSLQLVPGQNLKNIYINFIISLPSLTKKYYDNFSQG